jgi:glycosyltransferase involved in cell wall biosynthesis
VATRDRPGLLRESLEAIVAAADGVDAEVLVVVQGASSAAGVVDSPILRVVSDAGTGASRARNRGAAMARGDVLLFTDDDCVVPPAWVRDHLGALDDVGVAGALGPVEGLSRRAGPDPTARPRLVTGRVPPWEIGHGSNLAVRASVFRSVGGFDERMGPGTRRPAGEDADLIARILLQGEALRAGVGEAVRHLPWRDIGESRRNLRAYDVGAGVWVGKALRSHGLQAKGYVKARLLMLWRDTGHSPVPLVGGTARFLAGVARGAMLSPACRPDLDRS